jgi:hypothetical protein
VNVSVSRAARLTISRRGGQLWIWTVPIGGANDLIRTSFSAPDGIEFEHVYVDNLVVWFQRTFPLDEVTISWEPFIGLHVTWVGTPSLPDG